MSSARDLVIGLADTLATVYPTRVAELSNRPGTVTCAVALQTVDYETGAMCDPVPITVTCEVVVLAARGGEQGIRDLLTHIDPVADLIRGARFAPVSYDAGATAEDLPVLIFTATANGDG